MTKRVVQTDLWALADELNEKALALLVETGSYKWHEARGLLYARDAIRRKIATVPRNYKAWIKADEKIAKAA